MKIIIFSWLVILIKVRLCISKGILMGLHCHLIDKKICSALSRIWTLALTLSHVLSWQQMAAHYYDYCHCHQMSLKLEGNTQPFCFWLKQTWLSQIAILFKIWTWRTYGGWILGLRTSLSSSSRNWTKYFLDGKALTWSWTGTYALTWTSFQPLIEGFAGWPNDLTAFLVVWGHKP